MSRLNKKIKRGDLDIMIDIMHQTDTISDDTGEQLRSWSLFSQSWALLETSSGDEAVQSQEIVNTSLVYFTSMYFSGIDTKMRIYYNNNKYDILHIQPIGRDTFLKLKCKIRK